MDRMYQEFMPLQLEVIGDHCRLVPGLLETHGELCRLGRCHRRRPPAISERPPSRSTRRRPLRASCQTTVYVQEDVPDELPAAAVDDFSDRGAAESLSGAATVLKIGDTVPDIQEGIECRGLECGRDVYEQRGRLHRGRVDGVAAAEERARFRLTQGADEVARRRSRMLSWNHFLELPELVANFTGSVTAWRKAVTCVAHAAVFDGPGSTSCASGLTVPLYPLDRVAVRIGSV